MISARLVHLIEGNGEQIVDRLVAQIRHQPEMPHTRSLLDRELRDWGLDLLQHLGHWLSAGNEQDLALRYQRLGKFCFEHDIPLHEAVRGLCLLREKMLDFAQEHMLSNASIELYAEEELERRLGRFFDQLTINLVRGFERCVRRAAPETMVAH
ncbi:MAG TPA: hypothetical protein VLY04_11405 [Bryobacteraceae bacterium]|nr:hypothetical protein [Bryobacteraceae bacterium]